MFISDAAVQPFIEGLGAQAGETSTPLEQGAALEQGLNDFLIPVHDLRALEAGSSQGSDSVKARNSQLVEYLEQVKRGVRAWENASDPTTRQEGREILLKQLDDLKLLLKQNSEIEVLRSRQRQLFRVVLRDHYQRLSDEQSRLALEN